MHTRRSEQSKIAFAVAQSAPPSPKRNKDNEAAHAAKGARRSSSSSANQSVNLARTPAQAHLPQPRISLEGLDGRLLVNPQSLPPCLSGAMFGREAGYVVASPEGIRCKFTLNVIEAILTFHRDKRLSFYIDTSLSTSLKGAARILGYQELSAHLQSLSDRRNRAGVSTRSSIPALNSTLHHSQGDQPTFFPSPTGKRKFDERVAAIKAFDCAPSDDLSSMKNNDERGASSLLSHNKGKQRNAFAEESKPTFAEAIAQRAVAGRGKTLEDLDLILKDDANNAFALERRAKLHYLAGRTREALCDLNRAIAIEPGFVGALTLRSAVHGLSGSHQQALSDIDQAIAIQPQNAFALARRGAVRASMGRLDEALIDLDAAISLEPQQVFALAQRGALHGQEGRHAQAFRDFDQAIALAPRMAFALARRGVLHGTAGRHFEAFVDLNQALIYKPKDSFALAHRGRLQREVGLLDEALVDFNMAVETAPNFAFALACRGALHLDAGRHAEAIADFNATIALKPDYVFSIACLNVMPHGRQDIG